MPSLPRRAAPLLLILAAVLLAAVGQTLWSRARADGAATGTAEWIWPTTPDFARPLAAYAVRDFPVDRTAGDATLYALADDEYVIYLNGHRVGSDRYRPGAAPDAYPVAPLLVVGVNRLVAELRSPRGDGGFLAALVVDGTPAVVSDGSWRVVRRHRPGLVEGWAPIPGSEHARSWGRPPVGRWGRIEPAVERPPAAAAGDPCRPADATAPASGPRAEIDFGQPVTGYLQVTLDPAVAAEEAWPLGLFRVAGDGVEGSAARPVQPILPVPGRGTWTDSVPRTFRHVTVIGLPGPLTAAVLPVAPAALAALPGPAPSPAPELAGVRPPDRPSPVEVLVRKRLATSDGGR